MEIFFFFFFFFRKLTELFHRTKKKIKIQARYEISRQKPSTLDFVLMTF